MKPRVVKGDVLEHGVSRPILIGCDVQLHRSAVATVELQIDGKLIHGSATRSAWQVPEAIAAATAMAVSIATEVMLEVVSVTVSTIGTDQVCIALIRVPGMNKTLAGSIVLDDGDGVDMAAKAVLHAVNRVVTNPAMVEGLRNLLSATE